jgi:peptidoglycan/xylan/chitin deacetylase (PgdA/CDA1 family)
MLIGRSRSEHVHFFLFAQGAAQAANAQKRDKSRFPMSGDASSNGERTAHTAPLAKESSALSRLRTRAWKEAVALAAPPSVVVTRGPRLARKRVAITFDDGPDEMTERYLDVCEALALRATFFVIGANAEKRPDAVLEYVRRGHEVAAHGFTHTAFTELAPAVLVDELTRTSDLLPASLSPRPLVRPPKGAISPSSVLRTALAGFTTVLWSLDSDDCRTRDPAVVEARLAPSQVRAGEIILMHELQPWTLEALPNVVRKLRDGGFEPCTVSELLGY